MFQTSVEVDLGMQTIVLAGTATYGPFPIRGLACVELRLLEQTGAGIIPDSITYEVTNDTAGTWQDAVGAYIGFTVIGDDTQDPSLYGVDGGYSWLWCAIDPANPGFGFLPMPFGYARITVHAPALDDLGNVQLFVYRTA
jgi:hypothetical protein